MPPLLPMSCSVMSVVAMLMLSFQVSMGAIDCNHVDATPAGEANIPMIVDVCFPVTMADDGDYSRMAICNNGEAYVKTWMDNRDCEGEHDLEEAISDWEESVTVVCDANPCRMAVFETYDDDSSDGWHQMSLNHIRPSSATCDFDSTPDITALIVDECQGTAWTDDYDSMMVTCTGTHDAVVSFYANDSDHECNGTAMTASATDYFGDLCGTMVACNVYPEDNTPATPTPTLSAIAEKAADFKAELDILFCDGLQVGGANCEGSGIQEFVDSFSDDFADDVEDVSSTIQQMVNRLDNDLNVRASFLTSMADAIQTSCNLYDTDDTWQMETLAGTDAGCSWFSGNQERKANLPPDMEHSDTYGGVVSLSASTYRLPNDVSHNDKRIQNDMLISALLEETMLSLHNTHCTGDVGEDLILYCAMYFGSANGLFRVFPGTENEPMNGVYPNYDPRFRPWYVTAASGSKDVVILIDISGSMQSANRLALAKEAVIAVLQTLGPSSFVAVVAFSDIIELSCFGEELVAATPRNVAKLIEFVEDLSAGGGTGFPLAFEAAFDIFDGGIKSCRTSILFLTDGVSDDPSYVINSRNEEIGAVIFSYTLGSGADETIPRRVAENSGGVYTHIEDNDANLANTLSSYYLYYAYGNSASNSDMIVTSPYPDFDTGTLMVTMAQSVYVDEHHFVGVVGIDLPLTLLSDSIGEVVIGRESYSFVVNSAGEALIHPQISNPLTTLFTDGDYNAAFISDLEPSEFDTTLLTERQSGSIKIEAMVKQSAGDVTYNGYILEPADLLYFYSGVGPSSLSVGFVIFSEPDVDAPNVRSFGLVHCPTETCDVEDLTPSDCVAPFVLYHDLELIQRCQSADELSGSWASEANIDRDTESAPFMAWYLQPGGYEHPLQAVDGSATCAQLNELHYLTNGLTSPSVVSSDELPFGGFREEIAPELLNAVKVMSSMAQFVRGAHRADESPFMWLYFGTYHGMILIYPGCQFGTTYNPLVRPWYQRAVSYPDRFVLTTPYFDAVTGELVASGATAVIAPNSEYPFGVAAFDFEFGVFIDYWEDAMGSICSGDDRCYLVDSSALLLCYDGIADDMGDDDIEHKFFGDFEPTLMQSLLEREFFVAESNTNRLTNTIDIAYVADADKIAEHEMDSVPTAFSRNGGAYTVHEVTGTNLFVVHIADYDIQQNYPPNCPADSTCTLVQSPGCLTSSNGLCVSSLEDACDEPDEPTAAETGQCEMSSVADANANAACPSDMCAQCTNHQQFISDSSLLWCERDGTASLFAASNSVVIAALLLSLLI